jgi:rSAM/selenodomain-associated transferase 1
MTPLTPMTPLPSDDNPERLMIFAKAPVPGRVKTRLGLPPASAAALHAAFVQDVVARHQRPGRRVTVWRTLDLDHPLWQTLVDRHGIALAEQCDGPLGRRMASAFATELRPTGERSHPVVILGTDSPTLPPRLVDAAFAALADVPAVIGPASDGGYYLLGLRDGIPPIFGDDIEWGTATVFERTIAALVAYGVAFRVLDPWYDIDRPADLALLRHHLPSLEAAGEPLPVFTLAALHALISLKTLD